MPSHPLIERYFEGVCSPQELAELRNWLAEKTENRDAFARDSMLYLGLTDALRTSSLSDEIDELSMLTEDTEDADDSGFQELLESLAPSGPPTQLVDITPRVIAEVAEARRDAQRSRMQLARSKAGRDRQANTPVYSRWLFYGGMLAACVAIAFVLHLQNKSGNNPVPTALTPPTGQGGSAEDSVVYATVESALGAFRRDGRPLRAGDTLAADEIDLSAGLVQLRFQSGAVVTVESPARLTLVSANRAELDSGRVFARMSGDASFVIQTSQGMVTGSSTHTQAAFGVSVDQGRLEAHAFAGGLGVDTVSPRGLDTHALRAGRSIQVRNGTVQTQDADIFAFVGEEEYNTRLRAETGDTYARWLANAHQLRRHENLLLYVCPQLASRLGADVSVNLAQSASADASRQRGSTRDGRMVETLADREGFRFDNDADRLVYDLADSYQNLTLAAWVYLPANGQSRDLHALVMAEGEHVGDLHWQLSYQQPGQWTVRSGMIDRPPSNDHYSFRDIDVPLTAEARTGRWVQVTTTFDVQEGVTRSYLNGTLVGSEPMSVPGRIRLGRVHVGNWKVLPGAGSYERYFSGTISELVILDVTLDALAVKELYESTAR